MADDRVFDIGDLVPVRSSFTLAQFGDEEFYLEPCTGGKLIEISKTIGNIDRILSVPSAENISKLALMLMNYESSVHFKVQQVKKVDVLTGEESTEKIGGYKLLAACIRGMKEQFAIYKAILLSVGYEESMAEELVGELKKSIEDAVSHAGKEEDLKKKTVRKKTKKKKAKKKVRR